MRLSAGSELTTLAQLAYFMDETIALREQVELGCAKLFFCLLDLELSLQVVRTRKLHAVVEVSVGGKTLVDLPAEHLRELVLYDRIMQPW